MKQSQVLKEIRRLKRPSFFRTHYIAVIFLLFGISSIFFVAWQVINQTNARIAAVSDWSTGQINNATDKLEEELVTSIGTTKQEVDRSVHNGAIATSKATLELLEEGLFPNNFQVSVVDDPKRWYGPNRTTESTGETASPYSVTLENRYIRFHLGIRNNADFLARDTHIFFYYNSQEFEENFVGSFLKENEEFRRQSMEVQPRFGFTDSFGILIPSLLSKTQRWLFPISLTMKKDRVPFRIAVNQRNDFSFVFIQGGNTKETFQLNLSPQ